MDDVRPSDHDNVEKQSGVDPWLLVKIAAVATLIFILAIWLVNIAYNYASEKTTWPITSATEHEERVTKDCHDVEGCADLHYHLDVKYIYELEGETYTTDWREVGSYDGRNILRAKPSPIAIRYDPRNPKRSSFRMTISSRLSWIGTPIVLASLSFIWLISELIGLAVGRDFEVIRVIPGIIGIIGFLSFMLAFPLVELFVEAIKK